MDRFEESHFVQSPGYLTDVKGARRRRNSTLGMYADTQESSKEQMDLSQHSRRSSAADPGQNANTTAIEKVGSGRRYNAM